MAVHRGVPFGPNEVETLDFERLTRAMKFPALIRDFKSAAQITDAFKYIMEDPTLDEDSKAPIKSYIYTPRSPKTHHQFLERVQTILEESCFKFAARQIPDRLVSKGWTVSEQVELPKYIDFFNSAEIKFDESASDFFPKDICDTSHLVDLLHGVRQKIRNPVAHRLPVSDYNLTKQVHKAIEICVLLGDWDQAVEIKVLTATYAGEMTQEQALKTREHTFAKDKSESSSELEKQVTRAGLLTWKQDEAALQRKREEEFALEVKAQEAALKEAVEWDNCEAIQECEVTLEGSG